MLISVGLSFSGPDIQMNLVDNIVKVNSKNKKQKRPLQSAGDIELKTNIYFGHSVYI